MTRLKIWRSGAWLLALALVLAQQLGVMHRISHGPAPYNSLEVAALPALATPDAGEATRWAAAVFSGHADDAGCRLFDAHGQGATPVLPVLVFPAVSAVAVVRFLQSAVFSVAPAPFEARGPPSLR